MEDIARLERRLWDAADQLRANSKLTSTEYYMPVLGLIFLRHAYNRFLVVKVELEKNLPKRGGISRPLSRDDFAKKSALFLQTKSQFDHLLHLSGDKDKGRAIIEAMDAIEQDYPNLAGVLPKEFHIFDSNLLGRLLKIFNDETLQSASGDVFGRIYEYFLMKFAMAGAQDMGEFFTPVSLVQTIVNVIEPEHGTIFDPACGSSGMFVQTSHFIEQLGRDTHKAVTFYGQEKTATTIRLAKMNLAVHGLEGKIVEGNTFYEDHHEMLGRADFVMANPPFNVDGVDAEKIKADPRLPFGLPGVNNKGAVSNGNYLWISYFHSYLNKKGRAGFVMSSQASSAGHGEKEVRRKLIQTGHVDAMISIRPNFFYTRAVPCELWFFDKAKAMPDKVLMLDARNIFRKVTRKVYDFSQEQLKNLTAIVWLHRGQRQRFIELVLEYRSECFRHLACLHEAIHFLHPTSKDDLDNFSFAIDCLNKVHGLYLAQDVDASAKDSLGNHIASLKEQLPMLPREVGNLHDAIESARGSLNDDSDARRDPDYALGRVQSTATRMDDLTKETHRIARLIEGFWKELNAALDLAEKLFASDFRANWKKEWQVRDKVNAHAEDIGRVRESEQEMRYFHRQLHWLLSRFPDGEYRDVEGLVKRVDRKEIEAADWSLTPGRYVGVATMVEDEDFDFEQTLRDIHIELADLNKEAIELATKIQENFEELVL